MPNPKEVYTTVHDTNIIHDKDRVILVCNIDDCELIQSRVSELLLSTSNVSLKLPYSTLCKIASMHECVLLQSLQNLYVVLDYDDISWDHPPEFFHRYKHVLQTFPNIIEFDFSSHAKCAYAVMDMLETAWKVYGVKTHRTVRLIGSDDNICACFYDECVNYMIECQMGTDHGSWEAFADPFVNHLHTYICMRNQIITDSIFFEPMTMFTELRHVRLSGIVYVTTAPYYTLHIPDMPWLSTFELSITDIYVPDGFLYSGNTITLIIQLGNMPNLQKVDVHLQHYPQSDKKVLIQITSTHRCE